MIRLPLNKLFPLGSLVLACSLASPNSTYACSNAFSGSGYKFLKGYEILPIRLQPGDEFAVSQVANIIRYAIVRLADYGLRLDPILTEEGFSRPLDILAKGVQDPIVIRRIAEQARLYQQMTNRHRRDFTVEAVLFNIYRAVEELTEGNFQFSYIQSLRALAKAKAMHESSDPSTRHVDHNLMFFDQELRQAFSL